MKVMKKLFRVIFGTIIGLLGLSAALFGGSLLLQKQDAILWLGFLFFGAIGYSLINLGYAVTRGRGIRNALWFLSFITRRAP
jgi:predicted tellurium resistance membrane protein TerC